MNIYRIHNGPKGSGETFFVIAHSILGAAKIAAKIVEGDPFDSIDLVGRVSNWSSEWEPAVKNEV